MGLLVTLLVCSSLDDSCRDETVSCLLAGCNCWCVDVATCFDVTVSPNVEATIWTDEIGCGYSTPDSCEELEVDACEL